MNRALIYDVEFKGRFIVFKHDNKKTNILNKVSFSMCDISMISLSDNDQGTGATFAINGSSKQIVNFDNMSLAQDFVDTWKEAMVKYFDINIVDYYRNHNNDVRTFFNPINVTMILDKKSSNGEFVNMIIGVKGIDPNNARTAFIQNVLFESQQKADEFCNKIYEAE